MKRVSQKRKCYLLRKRKKRWNRRNARTQSALERRARRRELALNFAGAGFLHLAEKEVPLTVPENLSLKNNFKETVDFVSSIPELIFGERQRLFLNFHELSCLEPAAMLLLTGEIYRAQHLLQDKKFERLNGNYPCNPVAYHQLRELGFFDLLRIPEPEKKPSQLGEMERPLFIRFISHASVMAENAAHYIGNVLGSAFQVENATRRYLGSAVVEAMNNAVEHAYKRPGRFPRMHKRWWLTGTVDKRNSEFSIVLHDQGVGIPETLEPSLLRQAAMLMGSLFSDTDGSKIALATRLGQTSTKQPGRGKGFETMKKAVRKCDDGELLVLSNRGFYRYNSLAKEDHGNNPSSINGTILQWRVRHSSSIMELDP